MKSSYVDSMRLILSEKYSISDKDYMTLSDILLSKGLSGIAFSGGLVQLINLMVSYKHTLPISITFLKELWEYEGISFNFIGMIGSLVKNNVFALRKVNKDKFLHNDKITKSSTEDYNKDIFVIVSATPIFTEVFQSFKEVLDRSVKVNSLVAEGALNKGFPKVVDTALSKASNLLKSLKINLGLESFSVDDALGLVDINLVVSNTSDYSISDKDILKNAKKYLKGVTDINAYKDEKTKVFLSFSVSNSLDNASAFKLAEGIYNLFNALEIGE